MRGIDIIEAMGEIDPELIRDAKIQTRAIPLWLKGLAAAACLVCIAGITLLSLGRLLGHTDTTGGALSPVPPAPSPVLRPASAEEDSAAEPGPTPTPEPTPTPMPELTPTPEEIYDVVQELDGSVVYTSEYDVSLHVPVRYGDEVTVVDGEYTFNYDGKTILYGHTAFAFYDTSIIPTQDGDTPALVWCIVAVPLEVADTDLNLGDAQSVVLGRNAEYQYSLVYREPSGQCDFADPEAVYSYLDHMNAGLSMLEDFIAINGLDDDAAALAIAAYSSAVQEVEAAWSELEASWLNEPYEGNTVVLENALGLSLEVPAALSGDISISRDSFTFIEPISGSMTTGGGFIWTIQAIPWAEYYETFDQQDKSFTILRDPQDGLELLGRTENYAYVIQYPSAGHFVSEGTEAAVAYAKYTLLGRRIIQNFFDRNGIEGNPDWTLPQ